MPRYLGVNYLRLVLDSQWGSVSSYLLSVPTHLEHVDNYVHKGSVDPGFFSYRTPWSKELLDDVELSTCDIVDEFKTLLHSADTSTLSKDLFLDSIESNFDKNFTSLLEIFTCYKDCDNSGLERPLIWNQILQPNLPQLSHLLSCLKPTAVDDPFEDSCSQLQIEPLDNDLPSNELKSALLNEKFMHWDASLFEECLLEEVIVYCASLEPSRDNEFNFTNSTTLRHDMKTLPCNLSAESDVSDNDDHVVVDGLKSLCVGLTDIEADSSCVSHSHTDWNTATAAAASDVDEILKHCIEEPVVLSTSNCQFDVNYCRPWQQQQTETVDLQCTDVALLSVGSYVNKDLQLGEVDSFCLPVPHLSSADNLYFLLPQSAISLLCLCDDNSASEAELVLSWDPLAYHLSDVFAVLHADLLFDKLNQADVTSHLFHIPTDIHTAVSISWYNESLTGDQCTSLASELQSSNLLTERRTGVNLEPSATAAAAHYSDKQSLTNKTSLPTMHLSNQILNTPSVTSAVVPPVDPFARFVSLRHMTASPVVVSAVAPNKANTAVAAAAAAAVWSVNYPETKLEPMHETNCDAVDCQVLDVPLSDAYEQILSTLDGFAKPFLVQLSRHQLIAAALSLVAVKTDAIQFVFNQLLHSKQQQQQQQQHEAGLCEAACVVYLLHFTGQLVYHCCLQSAILLLSSLQDKYQQLLSTQTDVIDKVRQLLFTVHCTHQQTNTFHPKLSRLCHILATVSANHCDAKVLIVVKKRLNSLIDHIHCIVSKVSGITAKVLSAVDELNLDQLLQGLSGCNCVITFQHLVSSSCLLKHFTCVVLYDCITDNNNNNNNSDDETCIVTEHKRTDDSRKQSHIALRTVSTRQLPHTTCNTAVVNETKDTASAAHVEPKQRVFVVSQHLLSNKQLVYLLETRQNITLIVRTYSDLVSSTTADNINCLYYEDVTVDVSTGIMLCHVKSLADRLCVRQLVIKIAALSLKLTDCWLVIGQNSTDSNSWFENSSVVSSVAKLQATFAVLSEKLDNFTAKVVLCRCVDEIATVVRHIADISDKNTPTHINIDASHQEQFLLSMPCFNSISAQSLLQSSHSSLTALLSMSLTQLHQYAALLPTKVLKSFYKYCHMTNVVTQSHELHQPNTQNTSLPQQLCPVLNSDQPNFELSVSLDDISPTTDVPRHCDVTNNNSEDQRPRNEFEVAMMASDNEVYLCDDLCDDDVVDVEVTGNKIKDDFRFNPVVDRSMVETPMKPTEALNNHIHLPSRDKENMFATCGRNSNFCRSYGPISGNGAALESLRDKSLMEVTGRTVLHLDGIDLSTNGRLISAEKMFGRQEDIASSPVVRSVPSDNRLTLNDLSVYEPSQLVRDCRRVREGNTEKSQHSNTPCQQAARQVYHRNLPQTSAGQIHEIPSVNSRIIVSVDRCRAISAVSSDAVSTAIRPLVTRRDVITEACRPANHSNFMEAEIQAVITGTTVRRQRTSDVASDFTLHTSDPAPDQGFNTGTGSLHKSTTMHRGQTFVTGSAPSVGKSLWTTVDSKTTSLPSGQLGPTGVSGSRHLETAAHGIHNTSTNVQMNSSNITSSAVHEWKLNASDHNSTTNTDNIFNADVRQIPTDKISQFETFSCEGFDELGSKWKHFVDEMSPSVSDNFMYRQPCQRDVELSTPHGTVPSVWRDGQQLASGPRLGRMLPTRRPEVACVPPQVRVPLRALDCAGPPHQQDGWNRVERSVDKARVAPVTRTEAAGNINKGALKHSVGARTSGCRGVRNRWNNKGQISTHNALKRSSLFERDVEQTCNMKLPQSEYIYDSPPVDMDQYEDSLHIVPASLLQQDSDYTSQRPTPVKKRKLVFEKDVRYNGGQTRLKFI